MDLNRGDVAINDTIIQFRILLRTSQNQIFFFTNDFKNVPPTLVYLK
jgi:hypothetical protein